MTQQRTIRIGVIADTHGLYDPAIERCFAGVVQILHAGDIGGGDVIQRLQKIAPVVAVSGDIDDYEQSGFPRRLIIRRGRMKIAICHVLYERGQPSKDAERWLDREQPTVCVFGHSHRPTIDHHGHMILFNPGSAGPRRFSLPRGMGLLTITEGKVVPSLIRLNDRVNQQSVSSLQEPSKKKGGVR